jgi:LysR family transcriptional regulator for metE and metH
LRAKAKLINFPWVKEKLNPTLRRLSLRQLRAFKAVVRAGTISGAAQALSVTPPAVMQQLRQLTETLGLELLERTPQGARPTEAGQEVLATIDRIETALQECVEAIAELRSPDSGRVAVGVISTAKYFAPRALAAFRQTHPGVELRLLIGNRQDTIAALEAFELDIAVMGRPPEHFPVEQALIGDHPHVIVVPPDHPLAGRKRIKPASLASETFLLREEGSGTRQLTQNLLAQAGIAPRIGMEISSNETIKQAVMAGLGIALISAHTIAAEVEDRRLAVLDVVGLPIVRQWSVVKRREKWLPPAARALWHHLATQGRSFLPEVHSFIGGKPVEAPPRRRR